jgi:hypothetical protein
VHFFKESQLICRNPSAMLRLLISVAVIEMIGCNYPTAEQNRQARELATATTHAPVLDHSTINVLLRATQDNRPANDYLNKVYRVDIEVMATEIANDARDTEGHGRIHLTGRLPDNVSVIIDCYFADQDEIAVQQLKPHHIIRIRAQLSEVYNNSLVFKGCLLESE